jgi:hypothetical protein
MARLVQRQEESCERLVPIRKTPGFRRKWQRADECQQGRDFHDRLVCLWLTRSSKGEADFGL